MNLPKEDAPVKALFDLVDSLPTSLDQLKRVSKELLPFVRSKGNDELAAIIVNSIKFLEGQCSDDALGKMFASDGALLHCHMASLQNILRWWVITNYP